MRKKQQSKKQTVNGWQKKGAQYWLGTKKRKKKTQLGFRLLLMKSKAISFQPTTSGRHPMETG
jgi:hypothetical protein